MSAAGRSLAAETGHVRHADDAYFTPEWCTKAILPHLRGSLILDPCAGMGAILSACWVKTLDPWGIEINPDHVSKCFNGYRQRIICADALDPKTVWLKGATILTNPPYALAMAFVLRALLETGGKRDAAFLLRLNWLASQKRAAFHKAHPSDVFVLPKRPSFTEDGRTDATEYCWFVWGPGRGNRWEILDL